MTDTTNLTVRVHPVYPSESNFVRGINYIPEEQMMEVRLKNSDHGEIPYYYPNTSERRYEAFISANSYGKFYSNKVKSYEGGERNYEPTTTAELREQMETALSKTTREIVTSVKDNDPSLYDEHRELFEALDRRRRDKSVMYVEDNSDILRLTFEFRRLIVTKALNLIEQSNSEDLEWVQNCQEVAEECSSTSTTYMTLSQI